MGFLDRIVGGRGKEAPKEEQPPSTLPSSTTPSTPELLRDPSTSYGPPNLDIPGSTIPGLPAMQGIGAGPSGRLYDPYEGISAGIGKKHGFVLPTQPEFVFEEEAAVKRRGWSENLQFYTGIGYLSGGVAGVSYGAYTYATEKTEFPLNSLKLKANRLLNLAGSRAKPFSNGAAILGLFFASFESYLSYQLDNPSLPESTSTVLAGAVSGALFRSPRGPRQALAAGAVGTIAGGCIAMLRQAFPSL